MNNESPTKQTRVIDGKVERLWFIWNRYRSPYDGEYENDIDWEWRAESIESNPIAPCTVPSPLL